MVRPRHEYWVYILASRRNGTLYTGVTNDLARRIWEHREGRVPGFTARYGIKQLVFCEEYRYVNHAIAREKAIKSWPRQWKINLIERDNPDGDDLYEHIL